MGWRFRRSIRLAPGIRLNFSKSGVGISAGVRGLRVSTGPRGTRLTTSIPGTGLSYSQRIDDAASSSAVSSAKRSSSGCATFGILWGIVLLFAVPLLLNIGGLKSDDRSRYDTSPTVSQRALSPRVILETPTPRPTAIAVALAPAASTPSPTPTSAATRTGTINTTANLRGGPSTDDPVVGTAQAEQQVVIIGCNADCTWYELDSGAWIFAQLVTVGENDTPPTEQPVTTTDVEHGWAVVNTAILNARAEPSTDSPIVDTLAYGDRVQVIASQPEWQQVSLSADQTGWCWREYLMPVTECPAPSSAPVQEVAAEVAAPQLPYYVSQPFAPNAKTVAEAMIYECFGGGNNGLRSAAAGTPVQVLGTGPFQSSAEIGVALGTGPYLKIRIWDGQYAWIGASAVGVDIASVAQISGACEEYDRIDWSTVVRPTPTPAPVWRPTEVDSGSSRSCCKICTTGKACGDSCISRSHTCRKGPGCACDG